MPQEKRSKRANKRNETTNPPTKHIIRIKSFTKQLKAKQTTTPTNIPSQSLFKIPSPKQNQKNKRAKKIKQVNVTAKDNFATSVADL